MAAKIFKMTLDGKAALEAELEYLETQGRNEVAEKLKVARSYGDLSENSEYDEAKSEQAKVEARITELKYQLDNAVIVESLDDDSISIGSLVTVVRKADNKTIVYEIVGYSQADPANGKISDDSPVGKALVGKKVGDEVTVEAPVGNIEFSIVNAEKAKK